MTWKGSSLCSSISPIWPSNRLTDRGEGQCHSLCPSFWLEQEFSVSYWNSYPRANEIMRNILSSADESGMTCLHYAGKIGFYQLLFLNKPPSGLIHLQILQPNTTEETFAKPFLKLFALRAKTVSISPGLLRELKKFIYVRPKLSRVKGLISQFFYP